jgi:thiazole synthase
LDDLKIAGITIRSRLITGSGKYRDDSLIPKVLEAAECDIITVALRRIDIDNPVVSILSHVPEGKILLPNTSGARTAEEAVRLARLSKKMGYGNWIKIEVIQDQRFLLPDNEETVKASETLVKEGFIVMPYMNPDIGTARRLVNAGTASVMPLAAPIGSNKGLATEEMLRILFSEIKIPVIVDAGIGAPSHAAKAMEMGASAILLNTAIATADDPVKMAEAFKYAVRAGRLAYLSGLAYTSHSARASSPLTGFLGEKVT